MKTLPEAEVEGTHYTLKDMKRRLKAYRTANESQVAEPSVSQFFRDHGVQVFKKDARIDADSVFASLKIYVERVEAPQNFIYHDESVEAKRRIMVKLALMEQADQARQRALEEEGKEQEMKRQKEKYITDNRQAIREEQREQLDQKS